MTALILSQGVPMLLAGDELSQTQQGNNNTYCQDNELTWLNWQLTDEQRAWCDFVRAAIQIRRTQAVFRRRKFFHDRAIHGEGIQDISWFDASGQEMTDKDWQTGYVRCLGMGLLGGQIDETNAQGEGIVSDSFLILFNANHKSVTFRLSDRAQGQDWEVLFDTSSTSMTRRLLGRLAEYPLQARSVAVLRPENPP